MADPFSVAGSAIGVVSLGIKVCEDLIRFTSHVKDGKDEVIKISARLDMLADILEQLQSTVTNVKQLTSNTSNNPDFGITALATALDELRRKLPTSSRKDNITGSLGRLREWRQSLVFPFKRDELLFLKDLVQDLQQNLILALQALQL